PDHDDEFRLVIDLLGDPRELDRVAVADQGVGELGEEDGLGGDGLAALDRVVAVVQPDAEDLRRPVDRRQELGVGGVLDGGGGLGGGPGGPPRGGAGLEEGPQAGGHGGGGGGEVD